MYMNVTPLSHTKHWKQTDRQTDRQRLTLLLALVGIRIQCVPILTPYTINSSSSICAVYASFDLVRTYPWNNKEIEQ